MTNAAATKERPILFSGPMVRAILDGHKTQTRRVVKLDAELRRRGCTSLDGSWWDPSFGGRLKVPGPHETSHRLFCPYGLPGDRLWVRETWAEFPSDKDWIYRANYDGALARKLTWRPSIFMPRPACRLELEIVKVRCERLQDISEHDAEMEGDPKRGLISSENTHRDWYRALWDSINGKRGFGWDVNPWVWVVEFNRVGQ
jgi:hypothetical protein